MNENSEETTETFVSSTTVALTTAAVIVVVGVAAGTICDPMVIEKIKNKIKKVRHH